jgi:hypothetical protein
VKCGATTRLSSRVNDRPTKLSQVLEMGELRWKLAALATGDEWGRPGTMPSSALDALATVCDRCPKSVALEHNSHADKQGRDTPDLRGTGRGAVLQRRPRPARRRPRPGGGAA